jgi:hypothetical protein
MPPSALPPLDDLCALLLAEGARQAPEGLAALSDPTAEVSAPSPALLALLDAHRTGLREWLAAAIAPACPGGGFAADPAGFLAARAAQALLARNQFLPLDGERRAALAALHARALSAGSDALAVAADQAALARALGAVAADYRRALAAFTAALAPPGAPPLREVVAAEYTPALQLRVLGLEGVALPEPILDLGCGREARLVAFLRGRGLDARGVDRDVEPGPGLARGDWLELPLSPGGFGTVLSHLAFSLHFLHHHLRPGDEAARYARRYMAVLGALRPGGLFAYAPGLPFVEAHLPAEGWRVERSPVTLPPGEGPRALERALGTAPWYACRVWRRR